MLQRALEGIKVLDLSRLLPGPFLTMLLADMGADVVKVEAPNVGDYLRAMPPTRQGVGGRFLAINRNKRSLVLDLKTEQGRDAFLRMAERADVIVESFRPGVLERLGIEYEALRARNRKIILCSISGYGQTGPYRDRAGHDLNYIGLAGVLAMGGPRDGTPGMPGVQIADMAGGGLWGSVGILGALLGRERAGEGVHLDISMTEGALALLAAELGSLECEPDGDAPRPSRGNQALNGGLACYRVYQAGDGKYLSIGALEPKFWLALNRALGRKADMSELVAPPARQEAIAAELSAIFQTRPRDEWVDILAQHDCCGEPVLEMDELAAHPLHQARQVFFAMAGRELGPVTQIRTPLGAPERRCPVPELGEHSREVLAEYGFDDAEIARLTGSRA